LHHHPSPFFLGVERRGKEKGEKEKCANNQSKKKKLKKKLRVSFLFRMDMFLKG
jgi:hypothetical protein